MFQQIRSYQGLLEARNLSLHQVKFDHYQLNGIHDQLIKQTIRIALELIRKDWGSPPVAYSFFVMGSAGRSEQALWSDQDHGLVYQASSTSDQDYFLRFGEEVAMGLEMVGYPLCQGKVMASNPLWTKSSLDWHNQLWDWMEEGSWSTIRNLLIFLDARPMFGEPNLVMEMKKHVFTYINQHPLFLYRIWENTSRIKKGVGLFHHFLPERHGPHAGSLAIKDTLFFPIVNNVRLLAVKENIVQSSTLERLRELSRLDSYQNKLSSLDSLFAKLLNNRLRWQEGEKDYDSIHYLKLERLTKEEKKELKMMMLKGSRLHLDTEKMLKKGVNR